MCRHVSIWGFQNRVCLYPEKRNHPGFVNISPTVVNDASMERSSRVLHHRDPKIKKKNSRKFEIEFCPYPECPYPEKRNHLSFVNISPTVVIDTSTERSWRVLQHWNQKIWFFSKKFEIEFDLYFDLCLRAEINIQVGRSHHAPICRHRGCIVVSLRVDI